MKTSLFIISLTISSFCLAQNSTDSTAIKNKQMIEALKNRINAIDNIGNGENTFQKQIDELKTELARQNDSITKLLGIISDLKRYANEKNSSKSLKPSVILNQKDQRLSAKSLSDNDYNIYKKSDAAFQDYLATCNCAPLFYKPYQVDLNYKTIVDLNDVIKKFESQQTNKIIIVGHADKSGNEEKNIVLSKLRAENLKNYLIIASEKIKKEDIIIEWHGSSKPIPNLQEDKKELNRRTEIIIQ